MLWDWGEPTLIPPQNKLEAQYAAKRQAHENEVQDLKQQLEFKASEIRSLNASIDSLKSVNEELKVCHLFIRWLAQRVRSLIAGVESVCCHLCRNRGRQEPRGERTGP